MADETRPVRVGGAVPVAAGADSIHATGDLISGVMREIERVLDAKHVVGEPLTFGSTTVVPLLSVGFGFGGGGGGGGGTDKDSNMGQGGGSGGAGGGGAKPLAVLVIGDDGVRLEPIPEAPSGLDRLGNAIAGALERRNNSKNA